jgi:hypothetical protein
MTPRAALGRLLLTAGRRCSARGVVLLDAMVGYVALGRWLRHQGLPVPPHRSSRDDLFAEVAARLGGGRLLYLEFGVHQGASIRRWSQLVTDPEARFVGFDSFEGLPEEWNEQNAKGHFSVGGRVPEIDDPRVDFVVGWFDRTLDGWSPPPHDQLVVNLDADLYSSTATVFTALGPWLRPGTYLYLDELNDHHQELRALREFVATTGAVLEPVATAGNYRHWAFRIARSG